MEILKYIGMILLGSILAKEGASMSADGFKKAKESVAQWNNKRRNNED